jgi:hypothetical protein|tara:strand:+ start:900 stop:1766 length:867 start_codon:yes stop_codon:yes gene_type:complete
VAIKPITDRTLVDSSTVNRETQTSQRNLNSRGGGNDSVSITPGIDLSKQYSITLKDIDTSVMSYIKNVIKPTVQEANEQVKVTIMYGNEERWKSVRKRGVMRDKNNSLILPLIMLKRTAVEKSDTLPGYEHDIRRKYTEVVRKSGWSKDNRYSKFSVQNGNLPVYENLVTTIPNYVNMTYEFVLWTNFIEQMNPLIETFMEHDKTYWGDKDTYRFVCSLDSVSDASEMNQEGERFIKSTFSVSTKAYLLPEETNSIVMGKMNQVQKRLTPSKVVFGFEGNATNEQIKK